MRHFTRIIFLSLAIAAGWFILNRMSSGAKGDGLNLTTEGYPNPNDLTNNQRVCYLRFMGCQFGGQGGLLEVRELLDAELLRPNDMTAKFEQCFATDECYFATALLLLGRSPHQAIAARIAESGCFLARKFSPDSNIEKFGLHRSKTSHDLR
ncbi:MAG: hypothetical protein QNL68_09830 [Akkermansiaceae bacterium]